MPLQDYADETIHPNVAAGVALDGVLHPFAVGAVAAELRAAIETLQYNEAGDGDE